MSTQSPIIRITRRLSRDLDGIRFDTPSHVYNPLQYAWPAHREYLRRYGAATGRVLLLGMNPGPWGMAQTGVPFGDPAVVRDWFGIDLPLASDLPVQHPKYPIRGLASPRQEGSGSRVWAWARERVGSPDVFFARFFVWNYCPLLFLKDNRNLIPERLSQPEHQAVAQACDRALVGVLRMLQPAVLVAIGRYAEQRARAVAGPDLPVHYLLHPSPANPTANKHWPELAEATLQPWLPRK